MKPRRLIRLAWGLWGLVVASPIGWLLLACAVGHALAGMTNAYSSNAMRPRRSRRSTPAYATSLTSTS
jgi:hypothetical protein